MWYNLLSSMADKTRSATLGEAALYALLGFAIVFVGIAFLIFVVWLVGKIISKGNQPAIKKEEEQSVEVTSPAVDNVAEEALSEEVVAVIMAALTAYYQQNNPKCEFTVKRIKRI